jgi:ABC-2 type transport system permease protein
VKINTIKKYAYLYYAFFRASLQADLEYRANFTLRIITDVFWYAAQIFTFEVIYRHTKFIGHWDLDQTRVFLGILFVVDAFYMILLHDNLERFSDKVRKGDLDLLLVKPVRSQFMISFQRVGTANFANLILAIAWLWWSLSQLPDFNLMKLLWLLIVIPNGFLFMYTFRFCFACTAVIFTRSENLQFIWYNIYKLGTRPDSIYAPWMKYLLMTLVPVALIASVPARVIIDAPDWPLMIWSFFLGPCLVYGTTLFWKFCLKYYSSASS